MAPYPSSLRSPRGCGAAGNNANDVRCALNIHHTRPRICLSMETRKCKNHREKKAKGVSNVMFNTIHLRLLDLTILLVFFALNFIERKRGYFKIET